MITTIKGHSILEYQPPQDWETTDGIVLPSEGMMRHMLKSKVSKVLDIDAPPPDIHRFGRYVSGDIRELSPGDFVYFNRHDADEFEHEKKTYYRIKNTNALAYFKA